MKIALIDCRTALPGQIVGTLLSLHETTTAAFKAHEEFCKRVGEHVVTKIVTLREPVIVGDLVRPADLASEGERSAPLSS
jgi:hypothetical protein